MRVPDLCAPHHAPFAIIECVAAVKGTAVFPHDEITVEFGSSGDSEAGVRTLADRKEKRGFGYIAE